MTFQINKTETLMSSDIHYKTCKKKFFTLKEMVFNGNLAYQEGIGSTGYDLSFPINFFKILFFLYSVFKIYIYICLIKKL